MGNLRSTDAGLRTADTARLDIAPTEAWSYAPTSRYESSFKHPAAALLVAALVLVGGLSITSAVTAKAHVNTSSSGAILTAGGVAAAPAIAGATLAQGAAAGDVETHEGAES